MENYLFENKYPLTEERVIKADKLVEKKIKYSTFKYAVLSNIVNGLLALLYVYLTTIYKDRIIKVCAIIMVGSFIYNIIIMIRSRKQYKNQFAHEKVVDSIKRFGENYFEIEHDDITKKFFYDKIHYIEEDVDFFYLWNGLESMVVIDKNMFTLGNAEDFRTFIYGKCGGEPKEIWTENQFNKKAFKYSFPFKIKVFLFSCVIPLVVAVYLVQSLFFSEPTWKVKDGYETITTLDINGGVILFYTDEIDSIFVTSYEKKRPKKFNKVDSYQSSVSEIDSYNRENDLLFESTEKHLMLNGDPTIVFGVADEDWWEYDIDKSIRQQYVVVEFECVDGDYVLYYREVKDMPSWA